ncbi:MAG: lytic murein transglycosylase [Bauldia sp.]|nr:lytic murein transglycosylase [Bauldia sp.]
MPEVLANLSRNVRRLAAALIVAAAALASHTSAIAVTQTPAQWVESFWATAKAAGVTRRVYDSALAGFIPDPDVIRRSQEQAEFNQPIWIYLDRMVSEDRLTEGAVALRQQAGILARIEARYGVDRYVIAAIWGMESHYGNIFTNPRLFKNTIRSLATLAYFGGRLAKYGRTQLIAALKIVQRGDVDPAGMNGSWAGAMGHTQFIPTTFEAYGVDFDGDGHRNIWTSPADALASAANYLRASGWQSGQTWGYEVTVAAGYDIRKTGGRTLGAWADQGVRRVNGQPFPRAGDKATLYLPNGRQGPAFLLVANFRAIKRYNSSNAYALAVGHLADRLRGGGPFVGQWPQHETPLAQEERQRLQLLLTMGGYYDGDIDGNIGSGSRQAIRDFQRQVGLTPDGVESRDLLQRLERTR